MNSTQASARMRMRNPWSLMIARFSTGTAFQVVTVPRAGARQSWCSIHLELAQWRLAECACRPILPSCRSQLFATGDGANTGLQSGLDKDRSDYVGRVRLEPFTGVAFSARGRFEPESFDLKRIEATADLTFSRFQASATYQRFEPQPLLGYDYLREGLALSGGIGITENWRIFGSAIFDLDAFRTQQQNLASDFDNRFQLASASLGLSYLDECTNFTVTWLRSNSLTAALEDRTTDTFLLRLALTNLGDVGYSFSTRETLANDGVAATDSP